VKQSLRQIGNETLLFVIHFSIEIKFGWSQVFSLVGLFLFKDGQPMYVDFAQHNTMELS
jgi:hypothetical protein